MGRSLSNCTELTTAVVTSKLPGKNGSSRNRENLQYKKTADLVLLSLLMRTNGKCKDSHAP